MEDQVGPYLAVTAPDGEWITRCTWGADAKFLAIDEETSRLTKDEVLRAAAHITQDSGEEARVQDCGDAIAMVTGVPRHEVIGHPTVIVAMFAWLFRDVVGGQAKTEDEQAEQTLKWKHVLCGDADYAPEERARARELPQRPTSVRFVRAQAPPMAPAQAPAQQNAEPAQAPAQAPAQQNVHDAAHPQLANAAMERFLESVKDYVARRPRDDDDDVAVEEVAWTTKKKKESRMAELNWWEPLPPPGELGTIARTRQRARNDLVGLMRDLAAQYLPINQKPACTAMFGILQAIMTGLSNKEDWTDKESVSFIDAADKCLSELRINKAWVEHQVPRDAIIKKLYTASDDPLEAAIASAKGAKGAKKGKAGKGQGKGSKGGEKGTKTKTQ